MAAKKSNPSENVSDEKQVLITRIFDAPRELVFKAWTDPKQLQRWHAPKGCTIHYSKIDVREGGEFHSCIKNPEFGDCWCVGVYREIVVPERIVYTIAIADGKGNRAKPEDVGHHFEWPGETIVTVTFAEQDGKTKLTLHQTVSESLAKRTGAYPSWIEMLDHLDQELAKNF